MSAVRFVLCLVMGLAAARAGMSQSAVEYPVLPKSIGPHTPNSFIVPPPLSTPAVDSNSPADPTKYPTVELGGLLQLDTGWFSQEASNIAAVGRARDGSSFRSARLWGRGQLRQNIGYMLEMDFGSLATTAPGRPNFQNAFIEAQDLPWAGTVRLGRWKQPFSLETATSIRFLTFIERATLFSFIPFRRTGAGFFDASPSERWTYAASVFQAADDGYGGSLNYGNGGIATAERVTHLLWDNDEGSSILHIGLAHTYNQAPDNLVRFARFGEFAVTQTPVGRIAVTTPNQFDTGLIASSFYNVLGTELAWVRGPLSIQGEAMVNYVDRIDTSTAVFTGWYVYGSWFLTGEHRNYIRKMGAFDRVTPRNEFSVSRKNGFRGLGAWELAARLSQVNVNGGGVNGGELTAMTIGLNWHLNANSKLQFNYIHNLRRSPVEGSSRFDVYGMRMSLDF